MIKNEQKNLGYYSACLDALDFELLSIRFELARVYISPSNDDLLRLEVECSSQDNDTWTPNFRNIEGVLTISDNTKFQSELRVIKIYFPAVTKKLQINIKNGSVEIRGISADILARCSFGEIKINKCANIEVLCKNGGIEIYEANSIKAMLMDGRLVAKHILEKSFINTKAADIFLESCLGTTVLKSESGDMSIQKASGRLKLTNDSGDIELDFKDHFSGAEINTRSGDISSSISNVDLELHAESLSGKILYKNKESEDYVHHTGSRDRHFVKTIGKGGKHLKIKSISGDIYID